MPTNKRSLYEMVGGRFDDPISLIRYFTANFASLCDDSNLSIAYFYCNKDHTQEVFRKQNATLRGMLTHHLETDIMLLQEYAITNDMDFQDIFGQQSNNSLPIAVKMMNHGYIRKETVILIDSVFPFLSSIKTNDILFNTRQMPKLMAYKDLLLLSGLFFSLSTPEAKEKTAEFLGRYFNQKLEVDNLS